MIGKNVVIGECCVIGGDGYQVVDHKVVKHQGHVKLSDNVEVHGCVCIDRGFAPDDTTYIGPYTTMDNLVHIAHNCHIGARNKFAAGAILGGSVTVGDDNFFGLNCTIKHGVSIGNNNIIGMGAVVLRDIEDNGVWAGNPARHLRRC